MVGAAKGSMDQSENLFSTPARPERLRIVIERLWVAGDDVVEVSMATTGTKGPRPAWDSTQRLQGPAVDEVCQEIARNAVARFYSGNWSRAGRQVGYSAWCHSIGLDDR